MQKAALEQHSFIPMKAQKIIQDYPLSRMKTLIRCLLRSTNLYAF